jgi:hypothetical protein
MSGPAELSTAIPITIELPSGLDALLEPVRTAGAQLEHHLAEEVRRHGLEGKPIVELVLGTGAPAIRVRVHDELVSYPASEMNRAWTIVAPAEPARLPAPPFGPGAGSADEWLTAWAEPERSGGPSGSELATAFIRELVLSVILRRPECLVGQGQVEAFLATRRGGWRRISRDVAARDADVVLRSLLKLELFVADGTVVWEALTTGWRLGQDVEDIVEAAAAALRPGRIEVLAHPSLVAAAGAVGHDGEEADAGTWEGFPQLETQMFLELGIRLRELELRPAPELPERAIRVRTNHHLGAVRVARPSPTALADALHAELVERAPALVGIEDVEYHLSRLDAIFPELVSASLRVLSLGDLTRVLRALVAERVTIRDIRAILERLLQFDTIEADPVEYVVIDERLPVHPGTPAPLAARWRQYLAFARSGSGLRNHLTQRYGQRSGVTGSVLVLPLDRELEGRVRRAAAEEWSSGRGPRGNGTRALERAGENVLAHVRKGLSRWPPGQTTELPVLLVRDPLLRPLIRELVAGELPDLPVVIRTELRPDVTLQLPNEVATDGKGPDSPGSTPAGTPVRRRRRILHPRQPRLDQDG